MAWITDKYSISDPNRLVDDDYAYLARIFEFDIPDVDFLGHARSGCCVYQVKG